MRGLSETFAGVIPGFYLRVKNVIIGYMADTQTAGGGRDEQGRWIPGVSGNPEGTKPWPEEKKLMKRAIKEIVEEYKDNLANALPKIEPVIIEKAIKGDMVAIKEIHERVIGKSSDDKPIDVVHKVLVEFVNGKPDNKNTDTGGI
jgi:hypothetical protein